MSGGPRGGTGGLFGLPQITQPKPGEGDDTGGKPPVKKPGDGSPAGGNDDNDDDLDLVSLLARNFGDDLNPDDGDEDDGDDDSGGDDPELDEDGKPKKKKKPKARARADDDSDEDDDDELPDATSIARQLGTQISGIRIPDEFNLDDLASDDPVVRRKAFAGLQQQAVAHAIQMSLPLMQRAIQHVQGQFRKQLKESLVSTRQGISEEQVLSDEIPAYRDKRFRGMITFLAEKQKTNGVTNPYDRAKNIRKILAKMGVTAAGAKGKAGTRSRADDGSEASVTSGDDALNLYFPQQDDT